MDNILSALSIVIGVVSAVFLQWFSDISEALEVKVAKSKAVEIDFVEKILKFKVIPLLIVSLVLSALTFPVLIKGLEQTLVILIKESWWAPEQYDVVLAITFFVCILILVLTLYLSYAVFKLNRKIRKYDSL